MNTMIKIKEDLFLNPKSVSAVQRYRGGEHKDDEVTIRMTDGTEHHLKGADIGDVVRALNFQADLS